MKLLLVCGLPTTPISEVEGFVLMGTGILHVVCSFDQGFRHVLRLYGEMNKLLALLDWQVYSHNQVRL